MVTGQPAHRKLGYTPIRAPFPSEEGPGFAAFRALADRLIGRHSRHNRGMTMLSFRVDDEDAADAQRWADRLGVDRSEFLRQALHRHIVRLRSEGDIEAWTVTPLTTDEKTLAELADWGPAEDWSDWSDATG